MPSDLVGDVEEFRKKFGIGYSGGPRHLDLESRVFRMELMREELAEYAMAEDLEHKLDSLVDLVYVVLGTALEHGFDFREAWRRVHSANMLKVRAKPDGSDSLRGSGLDVVKPAGWEAPDLSDLVA